MRRLTTLVLGLGLGHLVVRGRIDGQRLSDGRRGREQLSRMRQLGQCVLVEYLWLIGGTGVGFAQLIEGRVAVGDVHNATGQRQCLQQFLRAAESSQVHGCDASEHLTGDVRLDGQRNVAQVNVTLVAVCVVEGEVDALLALETGVILAHLRQDADLIDHRLDHVTKNGRNMRVKIEFFVECISSQVWKYLDHKGKYLLV